MMPVSSDITDGRRRWLNANQAFGKATTGVCRVCGKPTGNKVFTGCSAECRRTIVLATSPTSQRRAALNRDKGVCCLCGCDTLKLHRILKWANRWDGHWWSVAYGEGSAKWAAHVLGLNGWVHPQWHMDHIVPVCQGGGVRPGMSADEILANLRTLCVPCHKARSKDDG